MCQSASGCIHAAGSPYAAVRVRRSRGQVEPTDGRTRPTKTKDEPEDQLLIKCRGTAFERTAADELRVAALQVEWSKDSTRNDPLRSLGALVDPVRPIGKPRRLVGSHDPVRRPPALLSTRGGAWCSPTSTQSHPGAGHQADQKLRHLGRWRACAASSGCIHAVAMVAASDSHSSSAGSQDQFSAL